jgi:hypothetical protein
MSSFPCLARFVSGSGQVRYRLGDRLVDRYLEFVAGRCRPNTLRAVVPLENRVRLLACGLVVMSGGSAVFVDQAIQHRFSTDSLDIEIDWRDARNFALTAGNPLGDALMRPGRVVVDLVLDQEGAQVRLAEDQHAVEELAAQGAEESFAGRVHPGGLNGSPQDPGADGLEDGVEGLCEV